MNRIQNLHPWDVSPREAIEIQERLSGRVQILPLGRKRLRTVGGADVCLSKERGILWAGVVVLEYPGLQTVEEKSVRGEGIFPYVPGLLSFREIPVLIKAFELLDTLPDLILCDGQGIAHPRRLGLASHLGLLLDRPTIGCAKSRLVGEFKEVGTERGALSYLVHRGERVGAVLRTRRAVKPLFVSSGHKITLDQAIEIVLQCCGRYRLPEPVRQAHLLVNRLKGSES
ncbi:MAG: deoxyribonuclease V [Deltaproteobacteria bacterium]|nr:deoxyribonuclease V [Deltaproteobacteria bacterium]